MKKALLNEIILRITLINQVIIKSHGYGISTLNFFLCKETRVLINLVYHSNRYKSYDIKIFSLVSIIQNGKKGITLV